MSHRTDWGTGITVNDGLPGQTRSRGGGEFVDALSNGAGISAAAVEAEFFATMRPASLIKRFATPAEVGRPQVDGGVVKSAS